VAGVVTFNAIQNTTVTLPFKRCSDKTATAMLNIGFAKVEKIKDIEGEISRIVVNSPARNMRSSDRQPVVSQLRVPPLLSGEREQENTRDRGYSNESSHNSRIRGLVTSKVKAMGSGNVDSRLREMEENNEKKVRMIKKEKEDAEAELDRTREKWKLAERKERELMTSTKELKDNLEKRRIRILDLESKISEMERTQSDFEKKIKVSQSELKTANENYESLAVKYAIL
jgi:chromosome segregation ATPase